MPHLIDERSRPGFRETYGALVSRAARLDVALTHLRLASLDLSDDEVSGIRRVRLLLAQVSAVALDAEAHAVLHRSDRADNLRRLAALLCAGRIEVRSAPLAAWAPDFSVFVSGAGPFALLVGPHRFELEGIGGPTLASVHEGVDARRGAMRFEELWANAHDIGPAIARILARAEREVAAPEGPPAQAAREAQRPTGTTISGPSTSPETR
jgi:hypothetical protein